MDTKSKPKKPNRETSKEDQPRVDSAAFTKVGSGITAPRTIYLSPQTALAVNRLIVTSQRLTQSLGRPPIPEELALEMDMVSLKDRRAILKAQAEGEYLNPALERRLKRAALKVQRIVRISQESKQLNEGKTGEEVIGFNIAVLVQNIVIPYAKVPEGKLIKAVAVPWKLIIQLLENNPNLAFEIPPYAWEELIAAAFDYAGYDEVTLTPKSGDRGRDVIAVKHGIGTIRIIDSVKAYKPGHLVRHDDVRALLGVLGGDPKASKGIITTTSDFAPGIEKDPFIKPFIPYRLELMNGSKLREWLKDLTTA